MASDKKQFDDSGWCHGFHFGTREVNGPAVQNQSFRKQLKKRGKK